MPIKIADYMQELFTSTFGKTTLSYVLDVATDLKDSEDYADPNAEVWQYPAVGSFSRFKGQEMDLKQDF